jgi:hypothetical protein
MSRQTSNMHESEERIRSKSKRARPFVIEYRWRLWTERGLGTGDWTRWLKFGTYRNRREMEETLRVMRQKDEAFCKFLGRPSGRTEYRERPLT